MSSLSRLPSAGRSDRGQISHGAHAVRATGAAVGAGGANAHSHGSPAGGPPHGGEEALAAALAAGPCPSAVRYRGFVLMPQSDHSWLVRPERSPMTLLPFRTPAIPLCEVKALLDGRLDGASGEARP